MVKIKNYFGVMTYLFRSADAPRGDLVFPRVLDFPSVQPFLRYPLI